MKKPLSALLPLLFSACSSSPTTTTPSAVVDQRSPDQVLQDKLERAVADLHYQDLVRGLHPGGSATADVDVRVPTVSGKLEMLVVHRTVLAKQAALQHCYDEALKKDPALRGSVGLNFTIEPGGMVTDVRARGVLSESFVGSCISGAFTAMVFPTAADQTKVGYLIVLEPPSGEPADPNGEEAPAAKPKRLPAAEGKWPIVVKAKGGIAFDKKPVEIPKDAENEPRIQLLNDAATTWQSEWTEKHPDRRFPGVVGVRIGWDEKISELKRITRSLAYAGMADAFVQSDAAPQTILALASDLTDVSYRAYPDADEPPIQLHVELDKTAAKLVWRKNWKVLVEERVMSDKLEEKICAAWRSHGEHRLPNDPQADALVLHVDDELTVRDAERAANAALACTRQRAGRNGKPERQPVFWLTLSVR